MTIPNYRNTYLPGVIQIPSSLTLIAATNAYPMMITVSVNPATEVNSFQAEQLVRLMVPITYGMFQANNLIASILSVNVNDITLDIDSRQFDSFVIPTGNNYQVATIAPYGSRNLEFDNNTNNVPFQSLNNIGN
jgi:hypothetical protein